MERDVLGKGARAGEGTEEDSFFFFANKELKKMGKGCLIYGFGVIWASGVVGWLGLGHL
jgi:hypothetical protein